MITALVSLTLSQPECTRDKELPVDMDHKMLEMIQEALQKNSATIPSQEAPLQNHSSNSRVFPALLLPSLLQPLDEPDQ